MREREVAAADVFCRALEQQGVRCLFSLPGTQTVTLFESLRRSTIRTVVPTNEMAATFMAAGYARASGDVGVVLTIAGPGFAYALPGIAEAFLDSIPLVVITLCPSAGSGDQRGFQALDQSAMAAPVVKETYIVRDARHMAQVLRDAIAHALAGVPGPVLVQIEPDVLRERCPEPVLTNALASEPSDGNQALLEKLARARKPMLVVAGSIPEGSRVILETLGIPICLAAPWRGTVAEDNPYVFCLDDQRSDINVCNSFLSQADLAIVMGNQLTHVATAGFRLRLSADNVVVAPVTIAQVIARADRSRWSWSPAELAHWRESFAAGAPDTLPEPQIAGMDAAHFFAQLRGALPRHSIVVTDSGLHQMLVRRHMPIYSHAGLIFPTELQSMGFGVPAAIGARLGAPQRPVVAVVGDGGFMISGMELLTAVRDGISLTVLVMSDGRLNQIRLQQLQEYGHSFGTEIRGPQLEQFARAIGARYELAVPSIGAALAAALQSPGVSLIEVPVTDSGEIRVMAAVSAARETVRAALGPSLVSRLKGLVARE